jgi:FHS family L-fucose permease-like MFS transporter
MTGETPRANRDRMGYAALCGLFFAWGFASVIVDMTVPFLKDFFGLGYMQALLVQSSYFLAYLFLARASGELTVRIGLRGGVLVGLMLMFAGAVSIAGATHLERFEPILPGMFTLAAGVTFLQVAANPLAAGAGAATSMAQRLTFAQAFNSLGTVAAPLFASTVLFGEAQSLDGLAPVRGAYLIVAGLLTLLGVSTLVFLQRGGAPAPLADGAQEAPRTPLVLGAAAIFLYVGAEVSISSTLINYLGAPTIGADPARAAALASIFWGGALLGRFCGAPLLRKAGASDVLFWAAAGACALASLSSFTGGLVAAASILLIGLFNSVQFPTIFALATAGRSPQDKARAAGWLCTAIVGGGISPLVFGAIADMAGLSWALLAPALSYAYIAWYARYAA